MTSYLNQADWDLSIYDRNGKLALGVEVKTKLNASPEWATHLRQNLLAHDIFAQATYFLMVFPDRFYLWTHPDSQHRQSQPTYQIDAYPILQPYFKHAGVTADQISGPSLELIIASWLGAIIHGEQPPEVLDESQTWLVESGLYDALVGGKFGNEVAA